MAYRDPLMKMLIADDDPVSRRVLQAALLKSGYEVTMASDGVEAWQALDRPDPPALVILDWMMPGMDGPEVCRKIRERPTPTPPYLILLTARHRSEDIVTGLQAGADAYLTKPFQPAELRARVEVAGRVVALQHRLAARVKELEEALARVKQLQGLLPICAWCKKVRDDKNYWRGVESYIAEYSEARFTHGICPDCKDVVSQQNRRRLGDSPMVKLPDE